MNASRAAAHTAGHIAVAMHFGFQVAGLYSDDGKPMEKVCFDWHSRKEEGCIVLAAGAAGELRFYDGFDHCGIQSDLESLRQVDPLAKYEQYVELASPILESLKKQFENLVRSIGQAILDAPIQQLGSTSDEPTLIMSATEIERAWTSN